MRDSHEPSTALDAGETAADADRLAVSEETTELAAAKDELYALSNKAQLGMQRADHHEAEATELATRVEVGRKEITEPRARMPVANIEEIACRLTEIDAAADASERDYEAQARLPQEMRRATLAAARQELEAALAEIAAARAGLARREAERAGAVQRRDDLEGRVAGVAAEEAAAGERLDALIGEERRLRDAIGDELGARSKPHAARGRERNAPDRRARELAAASWSWRRCARRRTGGVRVSRR